MTPTRYLSEEQHLLAAVFRRPKDDAPRLIYADIIQDRHPEWADFIRVQCEIQRLRDDHKGKVISGRFESRVFGPLRQREQELLQSVLTWMVPIFPRFPLTGFAKKTEPLAVVYWGELHLGRFHAEFKFNRGFIHEIRTMYSGLTGGNCLTCLNRGTTETGTMSSGRRVRHTEWTPGDCRFCDGVKFIHGWGKVLKRHPVQMIKFQDENLTDAHVDLMEKLLTEHLQYRRRIGFRWMGVWREFNARNKNLLDIRDRYVSEIFFDELVSGFDHRGGIVYPQPFFNSLAEVIPCHTTPRVNR